MYGRPTCYCEFAFHSPSPLVLRHPLNFPDSLGCGVSGMGSFHKNNVDGLLRRAYKSPNMQSNNKEKIVKRLFAAALVLCLAPAVFAAGPNFSFGTTFMVKTNIALSAIPVANTSNVFLRITSGSTTNGSWNSAPGPGWIRGSLRLFNPGANGAGLYLSSVTASNSGTPIQVGVVPAAGTLTIERPIFDNTEYYVGATNGTAGIAVYGSEYWGTVE